jgi:Helicase associated domain
LFQDGIPSSIDQKRIDMLNELGFTWDAQEASWERQMDELRVFHEKYGTCDVSRSDKDHRKLYRWIREQRRIYRDRNATGQTGGLSEKRITALKSVGFVFDSVGATFSLKLAELTAFYREHNHCDVTNENHDLYQWLQKIRRQYQMKLNGKESILQQRHIQALDNMEFPWIVNEADTNSEHNDEESLLTSTSSASNTSSSSFSAHAPGVNIKRESTYKHCAARPLKKRRID